MPYKTLAILIAFVALFTMTSLAQDPAVRPDTTADATYGRVKEFTAGQKILVDVDNAPDKEFNLQDKDVTVKVDRGLKVGDPVKITEADAVGKKKTVTIAKNNDPGVKHGDSDRKQK
jgi:hypothetical protein